MMHSLMGVGFPDHAQQMYSTGPILDEFSRQQALYESARKISRVSANSYRPANAMRVVKPSSANNSPQAMMQRRRTLMNDGNMAKRRQYALDQALFHHQIQEAASSPYQAYEEPVKRTSRPVSWHPSTQMQQPQMQLQQLPQFDISQYMMPVSTPYSEADLYPGYQQYPPTPAAYSGHTSPLSTFSPLSLPFTATSQAQAPPQYISTENWSAPAYVTPTPYSTSPSATEVFPSYTGQSSFQWETFAANGFQSSTSPPTPDSYLPATQPEPVVPSEESITYEPLDEPEEEEGEILVGMGLYDTPGKSEPDVGLDHYKTTTSYLLGSTYRKGAGLKLEEAWEPPKDEEEEDDDDEDSEEDANGDEQQEDDDTTAQ